MNLFGPRPQRHFERIVRTHQDRVFSFAVYLLGDRTEAADVTLEVLIRLWRHREALDEDRLLAWSYGQSDYNRLSSSDPSRGHSLSYLIEYL